MPPKKYPRSWPFLRPIAYKLCKDRDGELCADCHKRPVKPGQTISDPASQCKMLEVDHVDANKQNNPMDGSNWALRCHKCNSKKNTRSHAQQAKFTSHLRLKLSKERQIENGNIGLQVIHMTMAKSLQAEPQFNIFVDHTLRRLHEVKVCEFLDAAATDFYNKTGNSISQQTLSRYLDKRTNPINGDLLRFKDAEEEWAIKLRV